MTRRDLIQKVILGGATLIVVPSVIESCTKIDSGTPSGNPSGNNNKLTIDLTDPTFSSLNSQGGSVVTYGVIIANTGSGYVALDATCTHAGGTLSYNGTSNNFPCPVHGSVFSTSGSVLNGPAVTAVKSHSVSKTGNILTVTL
jgi:cytochrome b6-f complex iron-sulfur subunit